MLAVFWHMWLQEKQTESKPLPKAYFQTYGRICSVAHGALLAAADDEISVVLNLDFHHDVSVTRLLSV